MKVPYALNSRFLKYQRDQAIPLLEEKAVLFIEEIEYIFDATILQEWYPYPTIKFTGDLPGENLMKVYSTVSGKKHKLILSNNLKCEVYITSISVGKTSHIEGSIKKFISNKPTKVNHVEFTVVNFLNALGETISNENMYYMGRLEFFFEGWQVKIDKRSDYNQKPVGMFKQLKDSGGFLITHIGEIKRINGEAFETEEINRILDALHWLLSFAAGRHVAINFLEGMLDGQRTWVNYRAPIISPWKSNLTWFPKQKPEMLVKLLPVLMNRFNDEYFSRILRESLSWYLECFSTGIIENKLVVTQTTLEMLSWSYLVIDSNKLSKRKFKKNNTSDNIRLLLREFEIDIEYNSLKELEILNYDDGIHLLTVARNNIVHPENLVSFTPNQQYMILQLGVRYIELVLLRLLDFNGYYCNRLKQPLWEGDYDLVPWVED